MTLHFPIAVTPVRLCSLTPNALASPATLADLHEIALRYFSVDIAMDSMLSVFRTRSQIQRNYGIISKLQVVFLLPRRPVLQNFSLVLYYFSSLLQFLRWSTTKNIIFLYFICIGL